MQRNRKDGDFMEQMIRKPLLTEEDIQQASDELYQKLVLETEGQRNKASPIEEVWEEVWGESWADVMSRNKAIT